MLISIVVPIYNIETYIIECIESVLRQSYDDWELILVDDGSLDNCPSICDTYAKKDSRILVVHKTNGGLVSARKAGLEVANGDYVMPLDGDDFLDERCLVTVAKTIEQHSPDVVCFGYNIYDEGNIRPNPIKVNRFGFYNKEDLVDDVLPSFLHGSDSNHFPHNLWAKVYRNGIYKKYQTAVSSKIGMGEDGACTYPLIFNSNSIVILKECLHYYRQVHSSMTKVKKPLSWDNYDMVYQLYADEIDLSKYDMLQQYYRARTHNLFNIVLSQFFRDDKYSDIVEKINHRFAKHPEYMQAIVESNFTSLSMRLSRLILKKRLFFVLYILSKNKGLFKKILSN